jgi:hypothetical protein
LGRQLPRNSTAPILIDAWRAVVFFGAAASLCGCHTPSQVAGFRTAAVDPASPVYQDVMTATRSPGPYPKFSDIPKTPTDVRSVSAWAASIARVKSDQARLETAVADMPPAPTDTESFAAEARSQAQAPAPAASGPTEADAQSLRARATPPPKRRAHKR